MWKQKWFSKLFKDLNDWCLFVNCFDELDFNHLVLQLWFFIVQCFTSKNAEHFEKKRIKMPYVLKNSLLWIEVLTHSSFFSGSLSFLNFGIFFLPHYPPSTHPIVAMWSLLMVSSWTQMLHLCCFIYFKLCNIITQNFDSKIGGNKVNNLGI